MTWNYRVVQANPPGTPWYTIREVYYEDNQVVAMTEKGVAPGGKSLDKLKADLQYMLKALEEPVLEEMP